MAEHGNADDWPRVESLRNRYASDDERNARFLDLVQSNVDHTVPFERRGDFFISPGQVYELINQTRMGRLLIPEGEQMTRGRIRELMRPGEFGSPVAGSVPNRAHWRSYVDQLDPEDSDSWSRTLGILFEFDMDEDTMGHDVLDRVVTGREEIGILMIPGGMQAYRISAVLIDHEEFLVEEPCVAKLRPGEASEFITNMSGLMATPKEGFLAPLELAGIDLTAFNLRFGDRIDL
ncbi:MAG TPA: hypothetical protein VM581_04180 [Magnetospirillaceae bacterium]|nr:hypothetical protein [Magnetospirillaceae bacterium]